MPRTSGSPTGADTPGWAAPPQPLGVEALLQQILGLTAERTRIADEEAQQAQQQVQQAEQAPPEQANPLASSIATAGSRLATTLAGPGGTNYSKQLSDETAEKDAESNKARLANVTRLRTTYEKAADRAVKAGDSEAEVKARVAMKKIDEQMAKDKQSAEEARRTAETTAANTEWMKREDVRFKNDLKLKQTPGALAEGAGGSDPGDIEGYVQQVLRGDIEFSTVPIRGGMRDAVSKSIQDRGEVILPRAVRKSVDEVGTALLTLKMIEGASAGVNKDAPGFSQLAGPGKWVGGAIGANDDANQLMTLSDGFLATLARAAGEKGVLTDPDVKRAKTMLPTLGDPKMTAKRKVKDLREFLEGKIKNAKRAYSTKGAGLGGGAAGAATPANNDPLGIR